VRHLAALGLMICGLWGTALSQYSAEFSSYYSGNRYDFRLTQEQLSNTSAWLEDEPNPPLSPRTAKTAALTYLRTLFDSASAWSVNEIKLVPLSERWVYVVSFTPPLPRGCADCVTVPFSVVVTMDGNAVTAVVSRWEPQTPPVNGEIEMLGQVTHRPLEYTLAWIGVYDEVVRPVAGRERRCRSDQEPALTIRSVVGTRPVTNG